MMLTTPHHQSLPISARALACEILTEAETGSLYLDQILERSLAQAQLSAQDRAFVTALTNGTMRWRARLDAEIAAHFRRDYATARPLLKNILRTALFQIRFMDRVPAYAAIHEAVALARAKFGEQFARLVNAILRNTQRQPYAWPSLEMLWQPQNLARLAEYLSYPAWLLERWRARFGQKELVALAEACNQIPPITLRVVRPLENTERFLKEIAAQGLAAEPVPDLPHVYNVSHHDQITKLKSFEQGLCTVQDASGSLVAALAAIQPGDTVIDLCAAPGGKTLHMAESLTGGKVIAVDRSFARLRLLKQAAARLRLPVHLVVSDARHFVAPPAEVVLVDAPCSGLGVLSRRSDLRWRRRPEDLRALAALQKEILSNAARLVKVNGRLIYSTCTTEPEENDEIVDWFLRHHPDFALQPGQQFVPARFCEASGIVRTLPHRHNMDGSFAAHLKRITE
ncbi:16S rRNA (cytosine(967)-C(5))-methyltransferase RsmB [candidate division KSB1 bacterium]|nr:16S rRNA (cytosine(967)-C(5))-methyltransferase RsmB [candidate division KSB1 bacterium]